MEAKMYLFRRTDNDAIVEVPWGVMIEQDAAGFITLSDGVQARRCVHLELDRDGRQGRTGESRCVASPSPSDTLGFPCQQLATFEEDRVRNGFTDVEFAPDPLAPEFYQVRFGSHDARDRYTRHRGYVNKTGLGGVRLTQAELDRAAEFVGRRFAGDEQEGAADAALCRAS